MGFFGVLGFNVVLRVSKPFGVWVYFQGSGSLGFRFRASGLWV